ncbi:hypothetical protein QYE76_069330 [Lolium multiflorum]|uniref:Uncharacterized protein n=1 Tax=Lolium multiflorum TaxID=4521 RepID=A0AAD8SID8_LOLMU|nr:hypothetical protein QYE76_069330 [Lolium multiflorum]
MEREAKQKEEAEGAARDQFPPPPPPMTQQNFIQYMQLVEERQRVTLEQQNKFFQDLLQQNRVERPENQGVTLADFQNTKPISFAYAPEPMDAEDGSWTPSESSTPVYPAGKVFTWEEFARKFRESNVPESIVELKRREFESLEQKDKAILTYVREFSKLSRYAVEEVNTEDKKKKISEGVKSPVQAITLEDDFKQLQEEKRKKAKFEPKRFASNKPNTSLNFKPRYNNNNNNNNSNYYGSRKNQAFQTANQEGHMMKDCPNKKNGGGLSGGGGNRGNTGGSWKNKKPFGKLNCTSLEEVVNSDQAVIDKFVIVFIDDILIYSKNKAEHAEHLSKDGIAVNPSKVAAVLEWEAPKTVKEIRGFLGMAGYYRRFIEGFSKIAGPMTKLLRKNTPFVWSEECEKSFQTLKEKLTTAPVLAVPEVGKDYTVYWKANVVADALSRKSTGGVEQEISPELRKEISQAQIQLWEKEAHEGLLALQVADELNVNLKNEIMMGQLDDPFIVEEMRRIDEGRPSEFHHGESGSLWFQKRICVPDIAEIKEVILREAHQTPYSIHPGSTKMYMDLKELFWRNNMKREIAQYVAECHTCQRVKAEHQSPGSYNLYLFQSGNGKK